jgi:uncharacterized SAM-binding protein YcdF (DUF218 family)
MERTIDSLIETFILPPGFILVMLVVGILLLRWRPLLARSLLVLSLVSLYLLSTPFVSGWLMQRLEIYPALTAADIEAAPAQAIVVLSSGRDRNAREYGGDTVGPNTLIRCRYAAWLHQRTGLPVLASGGIPGKAAQSLAQMMADFMKAELAVREVWLEDRSGNTFENARYSAELLRERQIDTIFLVTQAWHLRRAVGAFETTGLKVIPAPTAMRGTNISSEQADLNSWLPNAWALTRSYAALREFGGLIWYRIRY